MRGSMSRTSVHQLRDQRCLCGQPRTEHDAGARKLLLAVRALERAEQSRQVGRVDAAPARAGRAWRRRTAGRCAQRPARKPLEVGEVRFRGHAARAGRRGAAPQCARALTLRQTVGDGLVIAAHDAVASRQHGIGFTLVMTLAFQGLRTPDVPGSFRAFLRTPPASSRDAAQAR